MIRFGPDILTDLGPALEREWLETNGLGGFASSTLAGLHTRRYHGLLVAATRPPVGRAVLLSKLEETLVVDGRRYELGANRYPGVIHPQGYRWLTHFRLDPFPIFTYEVEGIEIEKSIFMLHGENTTAVQYALRPAGRAVSARLELEVRPLIAFRDYHSTTHENPALDGSVRIEPGIATVAPYPGLPALHLAHDAERLDPAGTWYRNFEYEVERERGLDFVEDLYNPLTLVFDLGRRSRAAIVASTEPGRSAGWAAEYRQAEIARRRTIAAAASPAAGSPATGAFVCMLAAAADQYIVAREAGKTVIAGYHWFGDWGRDTMIALPGLTLVTGRFEVARDILRASARHVDRGMLPNRFPDRGEAPEYNTADASLWFFDAVRALLDWSPSHAEDLALVRREIYPKLGEIIDWHVRGTRYGIRVDPADGLLAAGEPGVQLTWMDAKVGDWVVTPRQGRAVEIQALWYNALRVMEGLARELGDPEREADCRTRAERAQASFEPAFWNESAGCLHDLVDGEARDASMRPNQVLAVSLTHPILGGERARRVVEAVERELLTPYGLRSLAARDPRYIGRYEGDPWRRDAAYHQGTVWAWLMGPFISAYVKVHGRSAAARVQAEAWLAGLRAHLTEAGLGEVSEIFDGDAPHRPRGCVAQAWSVAELLRATVEDVLDQRPARTPPAPSARQLAGS